MSTPNSHSVITGAPALSPGITERLTKQLETVSFLFGQAEKRLQAGSVKEAFEIVETAMGKAQASYAILIAAQMLEAPDAVVWR